MDTLPSEEVLVKPLTRSAQILDKAALFAMVFQATLRPNKDSIYENYDRPPPGAVSWNGSLP